jgi:hypothetical protein
MTYVNILRTYAAARWFPGFGWGCGMSRIQPSWLNLLVCFANRLPEDLARYVALLGALLDGDVDGSLPILMGR